MALQTPVYIENFGRELSETDQSNWDGCSICLKDSKQEEIIGHRSNSNIHAYHKSCLEEWINRNPSCPNCRVPLKRKLETLLADFRAGDLLLPAQIATALTSKVLEPFFPRIENTSKKHIMYAAQKAERAFLIAASLSIHFFIKGHFSFVVEEGISGWMLAYLVTSIVKAQSRENEQIDFETAQERWSSHSFKVGVLTTSSIALLGSGIEMVALSATAFATGALANYGVEKLHEHNFITLEFKEKVQKAFTNLSTIASLMVPVKAIGSTLVGGVIGAAASSLGIFSSARNIFRQLTG